MKMLGRRTGNKNQDKKELGFHGGWSVLVVIAAAVIVLAVGSLNYFSFLETQLFKEHGSYLTELADKASEIVDSVIGYSWKQLSACEYMLGSRTFSSKEELLDALYASGDMMHEKDSMVLVVAQDGNYYCSDHQSGRWEQVQMLGEEQEERQQVVTELPHKAGQSCFVFMKRFGQPVRAGGTVLTHIAVAVDIAVLQEKILVKGFGDQCYTYLIDENGKRLYKNTYEDSFVEEDNVLSAFAQYEMVHGEYDSFIRNLRAGENIVAEFEYADADGKKKNWYVSNASVASENWQILLFVPTQVLGAGTTALLNRSARFFTVAAVAILALVLTIIIVTVISGANKRLVRQKDEANRLLRTAAAEATSANQAKSDFLSHMSHDIRTPINGIMGMTDIALKNIGNQDKVHDCLLKISGSSQHLLGLINDVLDMSRIESGKTKVNHESFDIRTCLDNCVSIIGGQLATRDIELTCEKHDLEHPLVVGDELHLRQVFINILGNSVKFTPDGGKIFFRAAEVEHTKERVHFRFELEDTGIGMKEEFLPHLFEAFSQEDEGTRTTYKGTGLGMAITKKFIDLMEGSIVVESTLNVGTKFTIDLWVDIDRSVKDDEVREEAGINLKGMKVLLVEDIELNLEIAQSIMEDEEVEVITAMNGREAVDAFANNPPGTFDAIIMDIMMPVMDGITATKTIRGMDRDDAKTIPIIAMTANAYEEDIRNTHEAGMNVHLSKPIDVELLFKTLSRFYVAAERAPQPSDLTGRKILLVDDVELNLEIAQEMLADEGAVVTTAENGQEAVDAFAGNPPGTFDVILMDVHMPVMDGIEATRIIRGMDREDAAGILILAMTADVYEEDMEKTKAAGMNGHLTKPLNIEKMMWALSGYRETV